MGLQVCMYVCMYYQYVTGTGTSGTCSLQFHWREATKCRCNLAYGSEMPFKKKKNQQL